MKVFKFGGASVKDAAGIRNLSRIVEREKDDLIVVVSAFGKTTNALEKVFRSWLDNDKAYKDHLDNIYSYHATVTGELFPSGDSAKERVDMSFSKLKNYLNKPGRSDYDFEYDQIVSYGELWSTLIVSEFLNKSGIKNEWIDIREILVTDERFRDANVLWEESAIRTKSVFDFSNSKLFVTQGFIGGTLSGNATTLGREGSDYTAALLANMLDAESVTVWKDVPGLLNADPRWLSDARKLDQMSYREAVEMTFSGAKVIHPKTIKPLQNKGIPLYVKSFISPDEKGTMVVAEPQLREILPVFIKKENQLLISFLPRDFSFVMGDNLGRIFHLFLEYGIKVNLVEASAVSIDVCVDNEKAKVENLLAFLKDEYSAVYNEDVEILTIRHYDSGAVQRITTGREIFLEQRTRSTVRYVVRKA
ncbi:MAG: aspartate kinase [Bacteroidales bacterium]|jgi:aspartate kinase|nr:aspartate kinase [Bacteroidales bacterium]